MLGLRKPIFNTKIIPFEKSHNAGNCQRGEPKSLIVQKKVRTFCFRILVKNLAHTHGFEHETSGLESKHLTTRPRTRATCRVK